MIFEALIGLFGAHARDRLGQNPIERYVVRFLRHGNRRCAGVGTPPMNRTPRVLSQHPKTLSIRFSDSPIFARKMVPRKASVRDRTTAPATDPAHRTRHRRAGEGQELALNFGLPAT